MIAGVDIGGTKIAVGMVNEQGQVLARTEMPTMPEKGFTDALDRITAMIRTAAQQAGCTVTGIGVGCTGPVHPRTGRIGHVDFLPGWEDAPLVSELEHRFQSPVILENDADAAALGEWLWGAGRGARTFLYVTISTGIGAGLILDGRIYRGVDGAHPEIGHHVIDPDGPLCACGAHGCWESLASGSAMERWYLAHLPPDQVGQRLDARTICALSDSDAVARAAVQHTARYLGLGLANLVTLFAPEVIALGGGLMRSRELFWPAILKANQSGCSYVPRAKVHITPAALGDDVGVIGAAGAWLYHHKGGVP